MYQDVRFGYDINDDWNAYLGCDNFTDEIPPLGLTGATEGSGIYDFARSLLLRWRQGRVLR